MDIYQKAYLWASLSPKISSESKSPPLKFRKKESGLKQLKPNAGQKGNQP